MKKGTITISVGSDITEDEIREIRKVYKLDPSCKEYRLNVIISGNGSIKENLIDIIKTRVCS